MDIADLSVVENLAVFLGRPYTVFSDNVKYAFLSCLEYSTDLNCCFLSFDEDEYKLLQSHGLPSVLFESPESDAILRNAKFVISDSVDWKYSDKQWKSLKQAYSINLFHGLPLKNIGLLQIKKSKNVSLHQAFALAHGCSNHDAVISTSKFFTDNAFSLSFHAYDYPSIGYPRNDVLLRDATELDLLNVDQDLYAEMKSLKSNGWKTILYMPTFRDKSKVPFDVATIDFGRMEQFGAENKVIFILKLHPILKVEAAGELEHTRFVANKSDAYPLLSLCDLLITDYSSVYFDYLLLDRPILFYPYDLEKYINDDRGLIFDYEEMTPGQKVHTVDELYSALADFIIEERDDYKASRQRIRDLAFEHCDANSGKRLADYLVQKFL